MEQMGFGQEICRRLVWVVPIVPFPDQRRCLNLQCLGNWEAVSAAVVGARQQQLAVERLNNKKIGTFYLSGPIKVYDQD
jgi:hypothetical protein